MVARCRRFATLGECPDYHHRWNPNSGVLRAMVCRRAGNGGFAHAGARTATPAPAIRTMRASRRGDSSGSGSSSWRRVGVAPVAGTGGIWRPWHGTTLIRQRSRSALMCARCRIGARPKSIRNSQNAFCFAPIVMRGALSGAGFDRHSSRQGQGRQTQPLICVR